MTLPVFLFECDSKKLERSFLAPSRKFFSQPEIPPIIKGTLDLRLKEEKKSAQSSGEEALIGLPGASNAHASFTKARVSILFHCLQQGLRIHEVDVQKAVDSCENEIASPVQLEKLLESICSHVDPKGGEVEEEGASASCSNFVDAHRYIKKKFADLIRHSFEPVPALKKFFFFRTDKMLANLSGGAGGREVFSSALLTRHRRDTRDATGGGTSSLAGGSSDDNMVVEFKAEDLNIARPLQHPSLAATSQNPSGYATPMPTTMDHGSMSFLSHLGSETSGSSFSIDGLDDNDSPLFLQITASVKCGDDLREPTPLANIPTCLEDLLKECGLNREVLNEQTISVFLDLVYITFPTSEEEETSSTPLLQSDRIELGTSPDEQQVQIPATSRDGVEQLPDQQRHALHKLHEDIDWAIEDEIVFALTKSSHISEEVLERVAGHIEAFPNRPGCTVQIVPLTFVLAHDASYEIFERELQGISFESFRVVGCDNQFRYLVMSDGEEEEHPRYWLLFRTQGSGVRVFFQYREGQFTDVLPWRQALKSLTGQVKECVRLANQEMLLRDLHETRYVPTTSNTSLPAKIQSRGILSRICNRLLEPEVDDDVWIDDGRAEEPLEANLHFEQGHFSCGEVWSASFTLHPRLSTGPADSKSLGADTFKSSLLPLAVSNRENMYVCVDDRQKAFYLKVQEEFNRNVAESDEIR